MQTIAELPEYIKRAERLLLQQERSQLINFLAENPKAGVLIQGAGTASESYDGAVTVKVKAVVWG